MNCTLCPIKCGADREKGPGRCGGGSAVRVAKVMLHRFEEPVISGSRGSGAVFFSGCPLSCVFCQNRDISRGGAGRETTEAELAEIFLSLQERGAHNINLVTAGHYAAVVASALSSVKAGLRIPVVYNSSGYETVETLRLFRGLIDVYLPDFKYCSDELAVRYSRAPHYRETAEAAVSEMLAQTGEPLILDGLMARGVLVRHLVLPGCRKDGIAVVRRIAELFGERVLVSVMRQYTPEFLEDGFPELSRPVTGFEYNSVLGAAADLGLKGFMQGKESATSVYTPDFTSNLKIM